MELIIIRGLPGSGKTTFARKLGHNYYEADQFFTHDGMYEYDKDKISEAHAWCQMQVLTDMHKQMGTVVVANTFVKRWEIQPYLEMAARNGYRVVELTMSGPLWPSVHGVPDEVIERMKSNWEK